MSIIAWLVVGAIAGFVASKVMPANEGYGVIGALIAGIVGAMVGGFIFGQLTGDDWLKGITIGTILAAIVGALIVVFAWNMLTGRNRTAT